MTPRVFLNETHWAHVLDALHKEVLKQGQPPHGTLGQTWRLLAEANQHKRFTIEVENANPTFALGAKTDEDELENAKRSGWPKPRRDDTAG